MENLKINLCGITDKEKQNAVWCLNELGFSTGFKSIDFYSYLYGCVGSQAPYDKTIQFGNSSKTFSRNTGKEITIPELRDMVVLKRNDIRDATHILENGLKLYKDSKGNFFKMHRRFENDLARWVELDYASDSAKPIEKKEMKEYLRKNSNGTYSYIGPVHTDHVHDLMIEIPTGAEKYIQLSGNNRSFYKNGFKEFWCSGKWLETVCNKENLKTWNGFPVLWQRNPEPKQAEFLVKTDNGYVLQVLDENAGGADVVRIPDGAEIAILASGVVYFWKSHFFNGGVHEDWVDMKEGWSASLYLKNAPSAITIWQRETLNDQVASAEEYREMISNASILGRASVVVDIAQSCSGGASRNASSQGQSEFLLNNSELNHRVAKAFNAVRGTNLNEDDVNYIRELINLTISHYGERK